MNTDKTPTSTHEAANTPKPVLLKDYAPPPYLVDKIDLYINIFDNRVITKSRLEIKPHPTTTKALKWPDLILNGKDLTLISLRCDDESIPLDSIQWTSEELKLPILERWANHFPLILEIESELLPPAQNSSCEGLYLSGPHLLTQCEPESFRRITYFIDRPDILSRYTVTIEADKTTHPTLLSNGNLVKQTHIPGGNRHRCVWVDPYPKPCYLFAMAAGIFGVQKSQFTTRSGKNVQIEFYTTPGQEERSLWGIESLKAAMRWDEETFGLEYDLDRYMVVSADDFNMGAMENKGLNIFNSLYVLAHPKTATDHDYKGIQSVIGHEYFHNWTGNRVTCRDWFQLSLKEGLTVYRDQEFSCDMTSRAVRRIEEIARLRNEQFPEDSSPTAHPVRPSSYLEINNFYTKTIYEKGAEVIRMMETWIGAEVFRRGVHRFTQMFDGQAATVEDFLHALEIESGEDLSMFMAWYEQAGTPELNIQESWDDKTKTISIEFEQKPPTIGGNSYRPYPIPIRLALLDCETGKNIAIPIGNSDDLINLRPSGQSISDDLRKPNEVVARVTQPMQKIQLRDLATNSRPILSVLRNFSAPVRLNVNGNSTQKGLIQHAQKGAKNLNFDRQFDRQAEALHRLQFLLIHDTDAFSRWEAAQSLALLSAEHLVAALEKLLHTTLDKIKSAKRNKKSFHDSGLDLEFLALLFDIPPESFFAQAFDPISPHKLFQMRRDIQVQIATQLEKQWLEVCEIFSDSSEQKTGQGSSTLWDSRTVGPRALRNSALFYLMLTPQPHLQLAQQAFSSAHNMTDQIAALRAINLCTSGEIRQKAFESFYQQWKNETLLLNKWIELQALAPHPDTLERVQQLYHHPAFDEKNPNNIMHLLHRFGNFNYLCFHRQDGQAYKFLIDCIIKIDQFNPQIAARLATIFVAWRRFESPFRELMQENLKLLADAQRQPKLSRNVLEIVSKALP